MNLLSYCTSANENSVKSDIYDIKICLEREILVKHS